jgi:hypothetical protein
MDITFETATRADDLTVNGDGVESNPFERPSGKAPYEATDEQGIEKERKARWKKRTYAVSELKGKRTWWARSLRNGIENENARREPTKDLPKLTFTGDAAVIAGASDDELAALTELTNAQIATLMLEAAQTREKFRMDARKPAIPAARIVLTKASEVERKHIDWLWTTEHLDPMTCDMCAAMIPLHGLTLIAGREGSGKSTLCWWLTAQVTQGVLPGHYEGVPRDVVIFASEDSESKIRARLEAAGADLDRVHFPKKVTDEGDVYPLSIRDDLEALIETLETIEPGLVIFDPIKDFLGEGVNTDREDEVRPILTPLLKMTQDCGAAVVGLHHLNKSARGDFLTRLTGSGAFKNVARSVIGVAHDPNTDTRLVQLMKSNDGEITRTAFQARVTGVDITIDRRTEKVGRWLMDGVSLVDLDTVLTTKEQGSRGGSQGEQAKDALAKYLGDKKKPSEEVKQAVATQLGISERTVTRAFKDMGGQWERTDEIPSRTLWWLPKDEADE